MSEYERQDPGLAYEPTRKDLESIESQSEKSPEDIEREIEETRNRMSQNIDELGDRLKPESLKQDAKDAIRDVAQNAVSNVGEQARRTGSRLVDVIRENPLPVIAVGAGVASAQQVQVRTARGYGTAGCGLGSILFGILLFVFPTMGVLTLTWIIGGFAIVFGALAAYSLRSTLRAGLEPAGVLRPRGGLRRLRPRIPVPLSDRRRSADRYTDLLGYRQPRGTRSGVLGDRSRRGGDDSLCRQLVRARGAVPGVRGRRVADRRGRARDRRSRSVPRANSDDRPGSLLHERDDPAPFDRDPYE